MATGGKLKDLTDPAAVRAAINEFGKIGRLAFLDRYGFSASRRFFVIEDGVGYDSKPIAASAYGHQHGRKRALHSDDFSGGTPTVSALGRLGFKVADWTSGQLEIGKIYTRKQLRQSFKIEDATLNTGVFRPIDTNSIWLFVTRDKTTDRTQYKHQFESDLLYWQGQIAGRTDSFIIGHEAAGDELLVFYRESKRSHPNAGFRYEGPFRYLSHSGGGPTSFVLQRASAREETEPADSPFDPNSVEDGRRKIWAQVKRRQGQRKFRRELIRSYGGRCAVTGCALEALLEAAHIHPYRGTDTNRVDNGLLLRADIHTLFDLGLVRVTPELMLEVSDRLADTEYANLKGCKLRLPLLSTDHPSRPALAWHRDAHKK